MTLKVALTGLGNISDSDIEMAAASDGKPVYSMSGCGLYFQMFIVYRDCSWIQREIAKISDHFCPETASPCDHPQCHLPPLGNDKGLLHLL